ncbi:MAG: hypothetical protein DHS20C14_20050 [Phycisphaeraceae bacterium]|nr:MAG: hypothetical protein DHS20C14_20050 [Phycisphaeraceae bacterium]
MPTRLLAAASIAILCVPVHAGINILQNPGFESGELGPWFQDRDFGGGLDEDYFVDTFEPHSGSFSAGIFSNKELRQDFAPVAIDSIEEISFWGRHRESTASADVFLSFFYETGPERTRLVRTAGSGWTFFDVTSLLDAERGGLVGISVFGNTGFRFNFDDAAVSVVPAPATLTPVLALLVAAPRRRCPNA